MTAFIKICKLSTNEYLFKYDNNKNQIQKYKFPIKNIDENIEISDEIVAEINIISFKKFIIELKKEYPIENKIYTFDNDELILNDSVIYIKYDLEFIEMLNDIDFHQSQIYSLKQSLKKLTDKNHITKNIPLKHYQDVIKYYIQEETKAYARINTFKKKVLNLRKMDDSEFEESEESIESEDSVDSSEESIESEESTEKQSTKSSTSDSKNQNDESEDESTDSSVSSLDIVTDF